MPEMLQRTLDAGKIPGPVVDNRDHVERPILAAFPPPPKLPPDRADILPPKLVSRKRGFKRRDAVWAHERRARRVGRSPAIVAPMSEAGMRRGLARPADFPVKEASEFRSLRENQSSARMS